MSIITGYCMKCKQKGVEIGAMELVEMKNGRKAVKGICNVCGTKMFKILSKADVALLVSEEAEPSVEFNHRSVDVSDSGVGGDSIGR